MIKLTKKQGEVLGKFNKFSSIAAKSCIIELLFEDSGMLSETFNADELKLKAIQAILDGEWEVEEQLYYVKNKNGILLLQKFQNEIIPVNHDFIRAISYANGAIAQSYQLTRQEIIDYDPRYLEFLEEVE